MEMAAEAAARQVPDLTFLEEARRFILRMSLLVEIVGEVLLFLLHPARRRRIPSPYRRGHLSYTEGWKIPPEVTRPLVVSPLLPIPLKGGETPSGPPMSFNAAAFSTS